MLSLIFTASDHRFAPLRFLKAWIIISFKGARLTTIFLWWQLKQQSKFTNTEICHHALFKMIMIYMYAKNCVICRSPCFSCDSLFHIQKHSHPTIFLQIHVKRLLFYASTIVRLGQCPILKLLQEKTKKLAMRGHTYPWCNILCDVN